MWHSENSPSSKGIVSSPCVASGLCSRKDKKKQAKEEKDRQKQVEKKRRRLEKALATSAAIRLELEKKKQRKREEEQRLDEEGAALAESVALYVLLDEDSEGVTHLGAYREIDFQGFTVLSESNNALLRANNYVPYLSSRGHFDCVLSSGVNRHNSTACTFIDFGANGLPLQSFTSQNEFIHSFNQSSQVALRMAHKNQGELAKNNSESRFHKCQEAITNAGFPDHIADWNSMYTLPEYFMEQT
ncbi:hypothetical protein KP509_07G043000 [Ceratopteris richardii]|uniref:Uncharacterized protein n=1 Tax=Ceratopteris richardii TaxID=49495 RepID=A0A8T2UHM7_CERRI|nr:hypothetical protein KP509_07G043000 [Ceratopteris richardii]